VAFGVSGLIIGVAFGESGLIRGETTVTLWNELFNNYLRLSS
jgi:hypothetical protein